MNGKQIKRIRNRVKNENSALPYQSYIKKPFDKGFLVSSTNADPKVTTIRMNQIFLHPNCLKSKIKLEKKKFKNKV